MLRRPDRARARQPTAKFTDEIKFTITFNCKMKPAVRGPRGLPQRLPRARACAAVPLYADTMVCAGGPGLENRVGRFR